jgi:folate-binding protein YgfZ
MDRVELKDVSSESATFSLIGPESDTLLEKLSDEMLVEETYASHELLMLDGLKVRVAVGNGLALPGYTLIVPVDNAAKLWKTLTEAGATPIGDRVWEQLRIQQGRPTPDRELTEDYNPLEAGLWQTISFEKGCYIGQETIARLNTYKGVKQQLWGVRLQAPVEPGTVVMVGEEKVGKLTSFTETDQGAFGLAYIRTKAGGVALKVQVGDVEGEIVDVPFLTHEYQ